MECTKTLRLRVKDKHRKVLSEMARDVNQVWNSATKPATAPFVNAVNFSVATTCKN